MNKTLQDKIAVEANKFISEVIESIKNNRHTWINESLQQFMPFRDPLFAREIALSSRFERSFSTSTGSFVQNASFMIADEKYEDAKLQKDVSAHIPKNTLGSIGHIINGLDSGGGIDNYHITVRNLLQSMQNDKSDPVHTLVKSDLYFRTKEDEVFFELKAPRANKGQCQRMLENSLKIHCIKKQDRPGVQTYVGMAYNPWGEGNKFDNGFAKKNLDLERQVKIGRAYWDYLGGKGTYDVVIDIFRKIADEGGRERIRKAVIKGEFK